MHSLKYILITLSAVSIIILLVVFVMADSSSKFVDDAELWDFGTDCNIGGSIIPWTLCGVNGDGDLQGHTSEHSGTYAVRADDFDAPFRALQKTMDLSTCDNVTIEFMYAGAGIDSGEYVNFEYYNGTWMTLFQVNSTNDQTDGTPEPIDYTLYSRTILNSTHHFTSSDQIAFTFYIGAANDMFYFDDLNVTCNYVGTDTCTCAGLNNDWAVEMSDYCIINDACDLGTGTLSFTGVGNFTCNAAIDTTNMGPLADSQTVYIGNNCLNLNINA